MVGALVSYYCFPPIIRVVSMIDPLTKLFIML